MARASSSSTSPAGRELRGLADLDHAAGQVPVALVGELAEQHPAVVVADQHLADRALAGEEGVEQRPEPLGLVSGGSVASRARTTSDAVSARSPSRAEPPDALAPQPGPGGDPLRARCRARPGPRPGVPEVALALLGERVVDQRPRRARGVSPAAVAGVQPPGQVAGAAVRGGRRRSSPAVNRRAVDVHH